MNLPLDMFRNWATTYKPDEVIGDETSLMPDAVELLDYIMRSTGHYTDPAEWRQAVYETYGIYPN